MKYDEESSSFISQLDKNTILITSFDEKVEQKYQEKLMSAIERYDPENKIYSAFLADSSSSDALTLSLIEEISNGAQSDISKILQANNLIRRYINSDDIMGMAYQSIYTNVNTTFKLNYNNFIDQRNKEVQQGEAAKQIDDFNKQIDIDRFIRESMATTFREGNFIAYLRNNKTNFAYDVFPLGVAIITDYMVNGRPVVWIDMKELKNKLKKKYQKNKKGKVYFFENVDKEIEANYCEEIVQAHKVGDDYAVLDVNNTFVMRFNNMDRKYGLSFLFRALKPLYMLNLLAEDDEMAAKSHIKKIIHQKMRKELLGQNGDRKAFGEQEAAHINLMNAWKAKTVIVTTPPGIESIEYVESKRVDTNVEKIRLYRSKQIAALGISFLGSDKDLSVASANIALDQLMRVINAIGESCQHGLRDWYRQVFKLKNISDEFLPQIRIVDSEMLSDNMKRDFAQMIFTVFGGSYETCFDILGLDTQSEFVKRSKENKEGFSEVFAPRQTAYTTNNQNKGGAPQSNQDTEKQIYDKTRQEDIKS